MSSFESNSQEAEPSVSAVPLFPKKKLQFKTFQCASFSEITDTLPKEDPNFDQILCKKSLSAPLLSKNKCSYTHILIADDDPFQHLYYKTLFSGKLPLHSKLFTPLPKYKISLYFSGEDLLEKFNKVSAACSGVKLIIVDYQMGNEKLNGVEVCVRLRKMGYLGSLLLRTSETREYLQEKHQDFEELVREKVIDALVSKENVEEGKTIIFECLLTGK